VEPALSLPKGYPLAGKIGTRMLFLTKNAVVSLFFLPPTYSEPTAKTTSSQSTKFIKKNFENERKKDEFLSKKANF